MKSTLGTFFSFTNITITWLMISLGSMFSFLENSSFGFHESFLRVWCHMATIHREVAIKSEKDWIGTKNFGVAIVEVETGDPFKVYSKSVSMSMIAWPLKYQSGYMKRHMVTPLIAFPTPYLPASQTSMLILFKSRSLRFLLQFDKRICFAR